MDETSGVIELPLFPLNTVLFPGQLLPLHIFEPRYQQMIRRCLAEDSHFGVVLVREGSEVGDDNVQPHMVGTLARIVESTHLADGSMNILSLGLERFRIQRLLRDQPYLRGEVANFPLLDEEAGEGNEVLAGIVRQRVARYVALLAEAAGLEIKIDELPDSARKVGYLAAVAMQIDNAEKQRLLGSGSLQDILRAEITFLNRENALLTWMSASKDWPAEVQFGVSGTLMPN